MKEAIQNSIIVIEIVILLIMSIFTTVSTADFQEPNDEEKQKLVGIWIRNFSSNFVEEANEKSFSTVEMLNGYEESDLSGKRKEQLVMYCRTNRMVGVNYFSKGNLNMANENFIFRLNGEYINYAKVEKGGAKLAFDCSSFIYFLYNHTADVTLGNKIASTTMLEEHYTEQHDDKSCDCKCDYIGKIKELDDGELMPGDVIAEKGHVMMFNKIDTENNKLIVIDCGTGLR